MRTNGARLNRFKTAALKLAGWAALFAVGGAFLLAALVLWPMDTERYTEIKASGEVLDRSGQPLQAFLNAQEQWCFPRPLDEISPYLVQATVAVEDKRFFSHRGVDPGAVVRAACQNFRAGHVVSGASTLTMQIVKQDPPGARSLAAKAGEAIEAIRLDARLSKKCILQTYLNSVPYGLNLVGCEAASRRYFGKPAKELTISEAALLAGLPKSPTGLMPLGNEDDARQRRDFVLGRMFEEGFITQSEYTEAKKAHLGAVWHAFPMYSPHMGMRLAERAIDGNRLLTTLDKTVQARAEVLVQQTLRDYPGEITNAAMLVVDVGTLDVLARVGSGDFFETPHGGMVDACRALRSPGSTLKPFIYALALEDNLLYPGEMLCDNTLDYGRYSPENFNGGFQGLVPASEALKHSLNIPAITVLDRLGVDRFCAFLPEIGIDSVRKPPDFYGLGLTLGNCEVRLEEMAAAYAMLANLGGYRSLRTLLSDPKEAPRQCLSRGTCLALYDMLEQPFPEEFASELVPSGKLATRVCWKTGTSGDFRDAWAFAFNRHYLVGVWMGNNDGSSSKWLVGAQAALPLAARMFRRLPAKQTPAWPVSGDELKTVHVCALTGLPASPWCPHTRNVRLPRDQFVLRRCDVHRPADDGIIERWPGSALGWNLADVRSHREPESREQQKDERREDNLRILNPSNQAVFVMTRESNGDRIRLRASLERKTPLHWYLDDRYLGQSRPGAPLLLDLVPGTHRLSCMTPRGATDTIGFEVALPNPDTRVSG